ncbi:pyridoxal-phosphate dependent enzyme [Sinorhizobium meliloti]|nr:pyridoxal-phosphate dependent enzyme [Sinorhizobium meliloti]RVG67587.1 pyridoxal-phosphate dependent enzyme [Sinorhizobium meliloti]RVG96447.1 pyridoxal-phosphate dependent enzyme [Sinorhizobium meliloti]RVH55802.1 pyridoxal-phosphate dependent enzyme [Sinorhizobium meliloti]RVH66841.1 pyridoxal-phosphate dependent enzyme [Sinorhizobium meliloti]
MLHDLDDVDTIIVPVGGGGLISGIATAIKETKHRCALSGQSLP